MLYKKKYYNPLVCRGIKDISFKKNINHHARSDGLNVHH